ncbi:MULTISPECIES: hypothetical protein [Streptosporangium]|uniref:Fumarate reductase subunit D n=1 Tax=Streptosporangium brasiliense TaxID=47480 RepID=A0ABT9R090_9ACTN|nr:hypothetical protein [Streptosporangium brasiliense]MDP9862341.1 fumarate reductase subunit D [Streptosporangium brasiliense]
MTAALLPAALSTRWVVSRPGARPLGLVAAQAGPALTGLLLGFTALPAALMLLSLPLVIAYHRLARAVSPKEIHEPA